MEATKLKTDSTQLNHDLSMSDSQSSNASKCNRKTRKCDCKLWIYLDSKRAFDRSGIPYYHRLLDRDVSDTTLTPSCPHQRKIRITALTQAIEKSFPLPKWDVENKDTMVHFPYSNEDSYDCGYKTTLEKMQKKSSSPRDFIRVSIVIGESFLSSSMPVLTQHCDVVLNTVMWF